MLEKIKDIVYDVSDILLSLVIVALIFFVVSWKISDSLAFEIEIPEKSGIAQAEEGDTDIIDISEVDDGSESSSETTGSDGTGGTPEEIPASGTDASTDAKPGGTKVELVGVTKEIEIKSGSTGYSIGKLLAEAGLVPDSQTFINRVEELGLGAKLRSGTFTLSSDMSLDEVIYKISGQ